MPQGTKTLTASTPQDTALIRRRKAGLVLAGYTEASLARELGLSRAAVNMVVLGRQRSRRVEYAIARICGEAVEVLFPLAEDAA